MAGKLSQRFSQILFLWGDSLWFWLYPPQKKRNFENLWLNFSAIFRMIYDSYDHKTNYQCVVDNQIYRLRVKTWSYDVRIIFYWRKRNFFEILWKVKGIPPEETQQVFALKWKKKTKVFNFRRSYKSKNLLYSPETICIVFRDPNLT